MKNSTEGKPPNILENLDLPVVSPEKIQDYVWDSSEYGYCQEQPKKLVFPGQIVTTTFVILKKKKNIIIQYPILIQIFLIEFSFFFFFILFLKSAGNPRNSLMKISTYLTVERKIGQQINNTTETTNQWKIIATDADWETK